MKLPKSNEMRELDSVAIDKFGIPSIVLMENAGVGAVNMMEKELGPAKDTFAVILIGPGNNGGDGLVIGRHLYQRGCLPVFFFLVNPDKLKGDAALNLNIIRQLKLPFHVIDNKTRVQTFQVLYKQIESRGKPCYAIIDALFGTGLSKEIKGHFADAINLFNRPDFAHNIPIVAVDTPSGMDSNTGRSRGTCLKADYTAAFSCPKAGQVIHGSSGLIGKLHVIDIGIPPEAIEAANIKNELFTYDSAAELCKQLKRKVDTHKGKHGHLLMLAGSIGKTGAGILAAKGAQYSGCGLISLCVPYDLNTIFETSLTEAMTIPLPTSSSIININDLTHVTNAAEKKNGVVLGPGIGEDSRTAELVLFLYEHIKQPMVIDADGINILAKHLDNLPLPAGPRVFTPHSGELSRLIGKTVDEIENNRIESAKSGYKIFANNQHETVFILKGAGTLVVTSDETTSINTTGNPAMATAGMGDVLSGIIGSFLCQGMSPWDASRLGVFIHGFSGDHLQKSRGTGFSATELAEYLPPSLHNLLGEERD